MNYYEHHIGDYAAATAHLSLVEDAIYARMLRRYYLTEAPLPVEKGAVARLVGARSPDEMAAVEAVLLEFFTLADDGWHQKRCDEDIAKYRERMAEAEAERGNEADRKRRYRERRAELFDQLRAIGIIPHFNTSTDELVRLLSRGTTTGQGVGQDAGQDGDGTATHTPCTTHHAPEEKQKHVQRTAARFEEFWRAYPVKKGKPEAEKAWRVKGLDAIADQLLAHVALMQAQDDDWLRGYVPHGSTYIRGERWHDEPKRARAGPPAPSAESKTLSGMKALQGLKDGLVHPRNDRRPDAAHVAITGSDAPRRLGTDHGRDLD